MKFCVFREMRRRPMREKTKVLPAIPIFRPTSCDDNNIQPRFFTIYKKNFLRHKKFTNYKKLTFFKIRRNVLILDQKTFLLGIATAYATKYF